ncbi:hypothetical protein [Streptacidiphilus cavernicola]|uniref:Uncharacterized protein n=1 Tax=Streptacidiphilus cavernicola TaxID=3342716 RepID=A0ABV6VZF9_9ACTN
MYTYSTAGSPLRCERLFIRRLGEAISSRQRGVKIPLSAAWEALTALLPPADVRFSCGAGICGTAREPPERFGTTRLLGCNLMLDVLFVGVTILVFAVLALIVRGVEKL